MAFKYFNVKNGLVTGNILLHAGNGVIAANTFNGSLDVTGSANLGNVGNIKITGGSNSYILSTDGTGNLNWVAQGGASNISNGTSNVQVTTNGNVTTSVGGNANILVVTSTGANITGYANVTGNISSGNLITTGEITANTANLSDIRLSNGISANGSYGNLYDVLTSDGDGNTEWKARYYYSTVMYDFTEYGMGYQTIAPNQDPATLGFLANVSIPHGSVWMLVTNDGLDDPAPITIYSPNSKATPMMWVTIDGSGPYDPDNNPDGGDYWFNITPPA